MRMELEQKILVRQTVHETLRGLGLDTNDISGLQADMLYLRRTRQGAEDMARIVRHSALTLFVTTSLYLLWEAVKHLLK